LTKYANLYTSAPSSLPSRLPWVKGGFTRLIDQRTMGRARPRTGATITATPCRRKGLKLLGTKDSSGEPSSNDAFCHFTRTNRGHSATATLTLHQPVPTPPKRSALQSHRTIELGLESRAPVRTASPFIPPIPKPASAIPNPQLGKAAV